MSINEINIVDLLESGEVKFKFKKLDDTVKLTSGTRNLEHIPEEHHPKHKTNEQASKSVNVDNCTYYDLQANAWRSFNVNRLEELISYVKHC